jgi:hypothetical protein
MTSRSFPPPADEQAIPACTAEEALRGSDRRPGRARDAVGVGVRRRGGLPVSAGRPFSAVDPSSSTLRFLSRLPACPAPRARHPMVTAWRGAAGLPVPPAVWTHLRPARRRVRRRGHHGVPVCARGHRDPGPLSRRTSPLPPAPQPANFRSPGRDLVGHRSGSRLSDRGRFVRMSADFLGQLGVAPFRARRCRCPRANRRLRTVQCRRPNGHQLRRVRWRGGRAGRGSPQPRKPAP